MSALVSKSFNFMSRGFGKLSRMSINVSRKFEPKDVQKRNVISSTQYDMVASPNEPYYADQYWRIISPYLSSLPQDAKSWDLGCSQGRFTIMMAKHFPQGHVMGCDLSPEAIEQAKVYGQKENTKNIEWRVQDLGASLNELKPQTLDSILITEVTIFYPQWKQDLPKMVNGLKPGGLLIISFRSQYFDSLILVKKRNWASLKQVIKEREGAIFGSSTVYTWQTSSEIKEVIKGAGLELLELRGIGTCSGIPADPHDYICQPAELTADERKELMNAELELGKSVPDAGRYILAVAKKPKA